MVAAGQRWSALVDSPADLRELTVRTFLQTTQAPDLAVREGIERVPEELRAVVAAYDRLTKLQRAVLMLSYLEDITNTEIAGLVDRTPARVRLELDRGLAAIGRDPYSVRAAWTSPAGIQPAATEVSRAFARQSRHGRVGDAGSARQESRSERLQPYW